MNLLQWSHSILFTWLGIYGLLVIASIVTYLMEKVRPGKSIREIRLRVVSWWKICLIFTFAIAFSIPVSACFFTLLSFLAFKEYLSLIPTRRSDRRVLFWAYLAIPLQYYFVTIHWYGMFIIFVPVYVFLFLPLRMVLLGETKGFLNAAGSLHWGLMMTLFSLSHLAYLLVLPGPGVNPGVGAGLLIYLVLLTELNDVFQFIWGKSFGRHRISPTVSPNKTVEGFLGGLFTTTLLAVCLAPVLTPIPRGLSFYVGPLVGLGGFIGDIVVSALKRDIGVKDSGAILPGHGGILDRVDSLTYTAPLFFHFINYFFY